MLNQARYVAQQQKNNHRDQIDLTVKKPVRDETAILTEKDFYGGMGLSTKKPNQTEDWFRISIHPGIAPLTFHVVSASTTASTAGFVEVYRSPDSGNPTQTIHLDLGMRLVDMLPTFFNVQDVNFDGFSDIGVPVDGGAKWSAYQYWTYDSSKEEFVTSTISSDLNKINFNFISFDAENKQIITDNLEGAGWRTLYQLRDNHIFPIKEEHLDSIVHPDQNASTDRPNLHCVVTTITYDQGNARTVTTELPRECSHSMQTIPFRYPDAYKERFK